MCIWLFGVIPGTVNPVSKVMVVKYWWPYLFQHKLYLCQYNNPNPPHFGIMGNSARSYYIFSLVVMLYCCKIRNTCLSFFFSACGYPMLHVCCFMLRRPKQNFLLVIIESQFDYRFFNYRSLNIFSTQISALSVRFRYH